MFFKHIVIGFIILGVVGFIFGDYLFQFQATTMIRWQYSLQAYEAYERLLRYYPNSVFKEEAKTMMKALRERSRELNQFIEEKDKELSKIQAEREKKAAFH